MCGRAVLPSARGKGVGRTVLVAAEQLAAAWGCRAVGLHCSPKNTVAMQLYRACGYRATKALEPPLIPLLNVSVHVRMGPRLLSD